MWIELFFKFKLEWHLHYGAYKLFCSFRKSSSFVVLDNPLSESEKVHFTKYTIDYILSEFDDELGTFNTRGSSDSDDDNFDEVLLEYYNYHYYCYYYYYFYYYYFIFHSLTFQCST